MTTSLRSKSPFVLSLAILFVGILGCEQTSRPPALDVELRVAHAGGGFEGRTYSNSIAALRENFVKGFRVFEIDFSWTADGHLVCVHDWKPWAARFPEAFDSRVPTLAEFTSHRTHVSDPPECTLEELASWMRKHPVALLITDSVDRNREALEQIRSVVPDARERVLPQIYQPDEYEPVEALGFRRIIWTLYRYRRGPKEVLEHARRLGVYAITMWPPRASRKFLAKLGELGIVTWIHTVNECAELQRWQELGATEIYTDFLEPGACSVEIGGLNDVGREETTRRSP